MEEQTLKMVREHVEEMKKVSDGLDKKVRLPSSIHVTPSMTFL